MDLATAKSALIDVVRDIQISSGYDGARVSGGSIPLKDLPGFDSMICVEAMSMLSNALGVEIADDMNIFVAETGKQLLSIHEAAAVVCERFNRGGT